jgi:phosphate-selective porin OprO/OprP
MERGTVAAFFPDRNTGVLLQGDFTRISSKIHWNIGFTYPEDELGTSKSGKASPSGRFTYAFSPRNSTLLIHTGIDYLGLNVDADSRVVRRASRPEAHLAPIFVDTGEIPASGANSMNLEAAVVKGPLSLQGEFVQDRVHALDRPESLRFSAFYVYGSYVLTGETRPYDESRGAFGRIVPERPFMGSGGGLGAFEVAVRFSRIDLTDGGVSGGVMDDFTAALNWYAGPQARVSANVIRSNLDGVHPAWIFQARLQWAY